MPDTKYAFFTFSLPEDVDSNKIKLFSSTAENGTYAQVGSDIDYSYGSTTYEFTNIDETKWYKICFYNSANAKLSPLSSPVFGGNFSNNASPELFVSTTTDGSNYATINDVYEFSTTTTDDFASALVGKCLKRARSIIDLRTAEMGIDRFNDQFATSVARRKYNASLKIVKEAEICFALAMVYRSAADDKIMADIKSGDGTLDTVSIGATTLSIDAGGSASKSYDMLTDLSIKYANSGSALLSMLVPTSVKLSCTENQHRGFYPFSWKT